MQMSTDLSQKQDDNKKIEILPYANLTTLYNFRPMKKNIDLGIFIYNHRNNNIKQSLFLTFRIGRTYRKNTTIN